MEIKAISWPYDEKIETIEEFLKIASHIHPLIII